MSKRTWDHEDCPNDCTGELQQQDRFNVMCLECEGVWTHTKTEKNHRLESDGIKARIPRGRA